jgi:hypothetical protein
MTGGGKAATRHETPLETASSRDSLPAIDCFVLSPIAATHASGSGAFVALRQVSG